MTELVLIDATLELLRAALDSDERLAQRIGAPVAAGWVGFPDSLAPLCSAYLSSAAAEQTWGALFFLLSTPRTLVGFGGFKGPPRDRVVEIGYAIAPAHQRRGLATAAARAMIERAFASTSVDYVDAHTLAEESASTRVLENAGMIKVGSFSDPDDGEVWHWRRSRAAAH